MIFANGDLSSFEVTLQREGGGDKARIYTDEQTNIRHAAARRDRAVSAAARARRNADEPLASANAASRCSRC